MDYSDINNKWKQFLNENTFKEDKIIDPNKKKKKKKAKEDGGKEVITNEWEEFQHQDEEQMDEYVLPDGGTQGTPKSDYNNAVDSVEEEQLEEMSAMSGGAVQGHAGGAGGSFMSKKAFKRKWA